MYIRKTEDLSEKTMLTDCIGPAFYDVYYAVMEHLYAYFNLVGGRGSLKSSFISVMMVLLIMNFRQVHGVAYRRVADTLENSVFDQIRWAVEKLNVEHLWKFTKSPYRAIYKPTGQQILFKGLDKAYKSKSIKVPFGYIGLLWFEELDEYAGEEEIRKVQQSVIRGGDKFWIFKSMNPPKSKINWANEYIEKESLRDDTLTSHTTYLQAPAEWLGQQFIDDAEWLKVLNPKAYEHEYMGVSVGNGTEVFDNLDLRKIDDEEIQEFDRIYMGIDWGWYPDPFRWVKMHYDSARQTLYLFDEYSANKTSNLKAASYLLNIKNVQKHTDIITCDSAEKKSTADFRSYGINARNAEKGPNSVKEGLKWLQSRRKIVIDPTRCPETEKEFRLAEYETNKEGQVLSTIPDINNHSIDATRYAMERVWRRRGR